MANTSVMGQCFPIWKSASRKPVRELIKHNLNARIKGCTRSRIRYSSDMHKECSAPLLYSTLYLRDWQE